MEQEEKKFEQELYKKWFKASNNAGFLSITPWWEGSKFVIDIGKVNPASNSIESSTKCFVDAIDLGVYLDSLRFGTGEQLYPTRAQCPSPESFVAFGGTGDLARVFKIHWWNASDNNLGDSSGFAWKTGHFGGKVTSTGAIQPDFKDVKSINMIKVTRLEMAEISTRVNLALVHLATKEEFAIQ